MPTPVAGAFGFDELLARGGKPIDSKGEKAQEGDGRGGIQMHDFDF